jgi:hypothetical protein
MSVPVVMFGQMHNRGMCVKGGFEMKKSLKHLLCLGLLGLSGSVYAEGGSCPSGYYPVGGQGAQGCAPIPNYNNGRQQGGSQPPPRPTGYWVKTWGAIAPSPKGGVLGTAVGADSKAEAERLALADCKKKGGQSCQVDLAYHNQCAAMILGDKTYNVAHAASVDEASRIGIKLCYNKNGACSVYYSACTEPRFVKY